MQPMLRAALFTLSALAMSACASTTANETASTPGPGRDCFSSENVSGYNYIDNEHIQITVGANRRYILTTMFNARDLDWTNAIALRSSSGWICTGNGLGVEIIGGAPSSPNRTYPITGIERAPDPAPNADQGS
jgi:hypothetical protein